ncbi:MAG: cell envelope integrity protein CreD [Treponema sp.]|jgi:inner membrane protein|nr:cell envelope integrity protein CreD [Treponema sp.]
MSDQSSFSTESSKQKKFNAITSSGGFKIAILIILILLLLIPVAMISSLIIERNYRAGEAEDSIMEAWGSQFRLYGLLVRIPVVESGEIRTKNDKGEEQIETYITCNSALWITPKDLNISADFSTQKKRRGIFSVALFSGTVSLSGNFSLERAKDTLKQNQTMYPEQAEIIIGLANQKGIRKIIKADWNGGELFFKPGDRNFFASYSVNGVNASSPFNKTGINTFDIQFAVQGGKSIQMSPVGETTHVRIKTDWPSPSFKGGFLPVNYTLSESGFDAEWEISYLSRSTPLYWITDECDENNRKTALTYELFYVDLFKPLDHYALNTRAVKYAILFLIIPFLTLFFLEIFSKKTIHPAQYLLSGLANVIFYLLLLSISEHLSFFAAYLIAAAALTCMMTLYARSLLETWTRSAYMGLVMALLYLIMYLTLNAEDWALLIGSIAAFVITGVVMFLTRRLDWSHLNMKGEK